MIARLIGIIGSTHGVRFSARPPSSTSTRIASGPRPSNIPRVGHPGFGAPDEFEELRGAQVAARSPRDRERVEQRRVVTIRGGDGGRSGRRGSLVWRRRRFGRLLTLAELDARERAGGPRVVGRLRPLGDDVHHPLDGRGRGWIAQIRRTPGIAACRNREVAGRRLRQRQPDRRSANTRSNTASGWSLPACCEVGRPGKHDLLDRDAGGWRRR